MLLVSCMLVTGHSGPARPHSLPLSACTQQHHLPLLHSSCWEGRGACRMNAQPRGPGAQTKGTCVPTLHHTRLAKATRHHRVCLRALLLRAEQDCSHIHPPDRKHELPRMHAPYGGGGGGDWAFFPAPPPPRDCAVLPAPTNQVQPLNLQEQPPVVALAGCPGLMPAGKAPGQAKHPHSEWLHSELQPVGGPGHGMQAGHGEPFVPTCSEPVAANTCRGVCARERMRRTSTTQPCWTAARPRP
jgi:hypothetical protein